MATTNDNIKKTICYHVWSGIDISPQREYRPCCKIAKVFGHTLEEYQNNKDLKRMQAQFLKGEKPAECTRCWKDEDAGLPSKRQIDWEYIYSKQDLDNSDIRVAMLTFGNSCNLTCRSCSSYASSSWIKEEKKLFPTLKVYPHNNFYKNKEYHQELTTLSKTVTHVYIAGGEPFLSTDLKYHSQFLDLLSERADQISLKYITNCTVMPSNKMWEMFSQFKNVEFHLSIDGTESTYEYLRYPAKWELVVKNMREYQTRCVGGNNLNLSIGHTVSILNVYYLPEFLVWCIRNQFPTPYIGIVGWPEYYNIQNLPKKIKDKVAVKLNSPYSRKVLKYMYNKEDSPAIFDKFITITHALDQGRIGTIEQSLPEFYKLLK